MAAKVVHSHFCLMLPSHQQEMFKAHLADRRALAQDLRFVQGLTFDAVAHGEAAVGAVIGAQVREIERDVEADGVAKALAGKTLRPLGQRLKVVAGGRREQGHHVIAGQLGSR